MPRNGLRIALLTAGLIAAPAFVMPARAEDPAPPPAPGQQPPRPQEGGPNQGRPEGRREGRPEANRLDPAMLLGRVADVTKELDLSSEQKTKVDESIEKAKKTLGEGGAGESRERMMAFGKTMNELKDSIEATLSEDQKKQFNEKLPMMSRFAQAGGGGRPGGPGAPGKPGAPGGPAGAGPRPEGVAGGRPGQGGGYPGGGGNPGGGGADRGAMMMQMVDAALDKVELTADQRTKIKAAVTAEMEKMRDNAGGNGGGRPAYGRPGEGRPGEGRPGEGRPGEGRPSGGRPGERRPGEPRPGDDKPAPPAPAEPKDK